MPELTNMQEIMEDKSDKAKTGEKLRISKNYPLVAVPEKIVLCIDVTQDSTFKPYNLKDDVTCNPFDILKKTLVSFINNKHLLNSEHEFAVMSLKPGSVQWIQDFSSDPKEVISAINNLELECLTEPQDTNLSLIFREVHKHFEHLPQVRVNTVQFPNNIIRLILLYNSSYNMPKIESDDETFTLLTSSDYFHWDTLYLHDANSSENKCQDVYTVLLNASPPCSYVLESSRKVVKVFNNMAKLLAHPMQRFEQPCID